METNLKISLITHTPEPEKVVASAAKLCYSESDIKDLMNNLKEDRIKGFIEMLGKMGHESPFEHISFTFGIEGVSRSLTHQLVRHRIGCSYSQKSQRYVSEGSFEYIIPPEIKKNPHAQAIYLEAMQKSQEAYDSLSKYLFEAHRKEYISERKSLEEAEKLAQKKAIEDARYVLPNSCETKIIVTMNARALFHFFSNRCCCYDEKTEVLTKDGWKFLKDIKENDSYYSLNPKTHNVEYVKALNHYEYDYDGQMIRVDSQSIDKLITPNHKMYVSYSYDNKKFILDNAEEHKNHKKILMKKNANPINGVMTTNFTIPAVKTIDKNQHTQWEKEYPEYTVDINNYFKFLGVYLSDGYSYKSEYHYNIGISKGDETVIDKYKEILQSLTKNTVRKFKDNSSWKIEVHDRNLYNLLNPLGKALEKHMPDYIWQYDNSVLTNLFEGLYDGDMGKKSNTYYTSSKQLANDYQRLLLHLGYSGTLSEDNRIGNISEGFDKSGNPYNIITKNLSYRISLNRSKNEPIIKTTNRDSFSEEYYKGKVYCLQLEKNHILYVRRSGKTVWSGNSRAQWEIQELAIEMLKEVKEVAPSVFKHCGPNCIKGKCPEGSMSCGKLNEIREQFKNLSTANYPKG